jgi:hypothetical protein
MYQDKKPTIGNSSQLPGTLYALVQDTLVRTMTANSVYTAVDILHKNIMRAMEKFIPKGSIWHKRKHSSITKNIITLHTLE